MQTITQTIDQLTHEELKAYCIQQNQTNLALMAEVERLKYGKKELAAFQSENLYEIEDLKAENKWLKDELEHGERLANKLLDEKEALEASMARPDRLQSALNFLFFLDQTQGSIHSFVICEDESGGVLDKDDNELFVFDNFDQFLEIANGYISEHNKLNP